MSKNICSKQIELQTAIHIVHCNCDSRLNTVTKKLLIQCQFIYIRFRRVAISIFT